MLWRKLALNLLYARPSKNITTNYAENSDEIRKLKQALELPTPTSVRSVKKALPLKRKSTLVAIQSPKDSSKYLPNFSSLASDIEDGCSPNRSDLRGPISRRSRTNSIISKLVQEKKDDVRTILEASILNIYGNFDQDVRR